MGHDKFIISNFRSWEGENQIDLSSINLLLGPNSCGKSSIIHALALLKQSELSHRLVPKANQIDLGSIADQVNATAKNPKYRTSEDRIGFGLTFSISPAELLKISNLSGSRYAHPHRPSSKSDESPRLLDHAKIASAELDRVTYHESYDDLGRLTEIILKSDNYEIINLMLETKGQTCHLVARVTDNQEFWELFHDFGQKNTKVDIARLELLQSRLKNLDERLRHNRSQIQPLRDGKQDSKKNRDKFISLQRERDFIIDERVLVNEEINTFNSIPGKNKREKCEFLAKNLSFRLKVRTSELEDYSIVERITQFAMYRTMRGKQTNSINRVAGNAADLSKEQMITHTLSLLAQNALIFITPFSLLDLARTRFQHMISSVERIGPHRERPDRVTFVNPNDKNTFVGSKGENVLSIINQITSRQLKDLNIWLGLLDIPYKVKTRFNKKFNISQLILTNESLNEVSLADVGYGIGQVLPIVLTSMLRTNTIIAIEQPELHLHPKMQANLADLFIKSSKENGNMFILETHSEHIVLRLKRRQIETQNENTNVFDQEFTKFMSQHNRRPSRRSNVLWEFQIPTWSSVRDSVILSVIELPKKSVKSKLTRVSISNDGNFDTIWPGDFFPERYAEIGLGE